MRALRESMQKLEKLKTQKRTEEKLIINTTKAIEKDKLEIKRYAICITISIISLAFIISCFFVVPMNDFVFKLLNIDFSRYVIFSLDTLKLLGIYLVWCLLQAILMAVSIEYDEFSDTIGIALTGVFSYIYFIKEHPITFIADHKKKLAKAKKHYEKVLADIEKEEIIKEELEKVKTKAESLYESAIKTNDEALMQQAADMGEENAIEYFETKAQAQAEKKVKQEREELYNAAHNGQKVNRQVLNDAAKLGHFEARIEMAKLLIDDYCSDEYTAEEKVELIKNAVEYLEHISDTKDTELEFLWLFSNAMSGWSTDNRLMKKALGRIRELKNSGELIEKYENLATACISTLVDFIDKKGSFKEQPKTQVTQEVKFDPSKVVCRYFANGICGYKSGSAIIEHCYRDDGTWKVCPYYKSRI